MPAGASRILPDVEAGAIGKARELGDIDANGHAARGGGIATIRLARQNRGLDDLNPARIILRPGGRRL